MENRRLLIVGLDPGVTLGFAILDIDGTQLKITSSKILHFDELISCAISLGKVVLVGTDKAKTPGLVYSFATRLGAKVVSPHEDIKVSEKKAMTSGFRVEDDHQGDALASALFAYKSAKPLLDKIDKFARESGRWEIRSKIKELAITKKISIKSAISLIENKNEEEEILSKVIVEKKLAEKDFLRLYEKIRSCETEIRILREYSSRLKNTVSAFEKAAKIQKETDKTGRFDKSKNDFRDNKIRFLQNLVRSKDSGIHQMKSSLARLNGIISNVNNYYILKRLRNLGIGEFRFKNKFLNITGNDILLVDEPNIVSDEVVSLIKNRIFIIVHKNPISSNNERNLPFIFMNSKSLKIEEERNFAFVEKRHFDMQKDRINWVEKIVKDYIKEKNLDV